MPKLRTAFCIGALVGVFISLGIATATGGWIFAGETFFWIFFGAPIGLLGLACAGVTLYIGLVLRVLTFVRQTVWKSSVQTA